MGTRGITRCSLSEESNKGKVKMRLLSDSILIPASKIRVVNRSTS